MKELVKTNDLVLITLIEVLLKEQQIEFLVLDQNMSVLEGSVGAIPRRIMVLNDDLARASNVLREADIGLELEQHKN